MLGAVRQIAGWIAFGRQNTPDLRYQPLAGWVTGLGGSTTVLWVVTAVCTVAVFAAVLRSPRTADDEDVDEDVVYDVGLVIMLAVLVSPVGWFYYHLLAIPAWAAALSLPALRRRWAAAAWRNALIVAGVLLSGILTFGNFVPAPLMLLRRYNYVWGALVLIGALVARRLLSPQRSAQPI